MGRTEIITERQCFSRIGGAYFAMLALTMLLQVVLVFALQWFAPAAAGLPGVEWIVSLAPMYLAGVPVCVLLLRRVPRARPPQRRMGALALGKWLLICFGLMYAGSFVGQLVMQLIGMVYGAPVPDALSDLMGQSSVLVNLGAAVVLAPIIEETLFRKLLLDRTRQFGDAFAIVLSGVLFGLFHGNFYQFFYATGVGMALAYVYTRTGRLRYPVALHMALNFAGAVAVPWVMEAGMALDAPMLSALALGLCSLAMLGTMAAGLTLLARSYRHLTLLPGACPLPRAGRWRCVLGSAGMLAFLLASAALFAMNLSI